MWWPVARRRTVARWRSLLVLATRLLPLRLLTIALWRSPLVLATRLLGRQVIRVLLIRHESFSPFVRYAFIQTSEYVIQTHCVAGSFTDDGHGRDLDRDDGRSVRHRSLLRYAAERLSA